MKSYMKTKSKRVVLKNRVKDRGRKYSFKILIWSLIVESPAPFTPAY